MTTTDARKRIAENLARMRAERTGVADDRHLLRTYAEQILATNPHALARSMARRTLAVLDELDRLDPSAPAHDQKD